MEETREQPDGEDEDSDELDPRVEIELEKLNTASNDINILEKQLDEARNLFRQRLTDATRNLKALGKEIGSHIDKARPYFEAVSQAKKAQSECQNAAATFERACQLHKGAREAIAVAEDKLMQNPTMFDAAWQEMLNNSNLKIMEAERDKLANEVFHQEAMLAYQQLQERVSRLEKQLKRSINKSKPYFQERAEYMGYLEAQKIKVHQLEKSYEGAKKQYSESLRKLEEISEDIHKKRNEENYVRPSSATPTPTREECIGAEAESPTRKKSTLRKQSEERIKQVLAQRCYASSRFRSSLLLDLDIDFDIGDSVDSAGTPCKSPSSKSVDIGCVQMNYYNDFQVLDVAPFLKRERSLSERQVGAIGSAKYFSSFTSPSKPRAATTTSTCSNSSAEEITTDMIIPDIHNMHLTHVDNDNTFVSRDITPGITRKESRLVLINKFSKITEDKIAEETVPENAADSTPGELGRNSCNDASLSDASNSKEKISDDVFDNNASDHVLKSSNMTVLKLVESIHKSVSDDDAIEHLANSSMKVNEEDSNIE